MSETFAYFLVEDPATLALPLPVQSADRIAVVRGTAPNEQTYYALLLNSIGFPSYTHVAPLNGDTVTATVGLGALVLEPAAAIATLTVVLPPTPLDGQVFALSTTADITALSATAAGGITVLGGGPFTLAGNGGVAWRYRVANTSWYRVY